jgi:hypothetical protein
MFNKKLATLAVVTTMLATTGVPVLAATRDVPRGSGEEIVYENQGLTKSVVDSNGGISTYGIISGAVGSGDTKGYWIRGDKKFSGKKHVYSSYKNYKYEGAASVTSGTGVYVDGGYKPADTMSTAHTKWTSSGTNKANYRYR